MMNPIKFFAVCFALSLVVLPSCLGNDGYNDYAEWKALNDQYIYDAETEMAGGGPRYEKIVPDWDKSVFVLMQWHNDRLQDTDRLYPLSNSTVTLNYTLTTVEGDTLDQGASFQCQPNNMITGFSLAVTNMNVSDTVTTIIPYTAGYGIYGSGSILPYSTLIFGIRLESIDKLY